MNFCAAIFILNMEENMQHVHYTMIYYFKEVKNTTEMPKKKKKKCPGWCSSVDGALACKSKGCWFDSQSGHMPGLGARSPAGGTWGTTIHWCFSPCLSPSLPHSLKNKLKNNFLKRKQFLLKKYIKRFVQHMEKVLWLIKCVKSGLQSFLVFLTFWPNNSLLWGCLMHWEMFSSTPGLYPLGANSGRWTT